MAASFGSMRLRQAQQDSRAPFEKATIRKRRSACMQRFVGRPANRHENLFWFDHHGPHFLLDVIQTVLLAMALYIASAAVMFQKDACTEAAWCAVAYVAIAVPPICVGIVLPFVIELTVLVSNVESMKKRYIIHEVVRQQKTVRSMRALRLLTAMKMYVIEHARQAAGAVAKGGGTEHAGDAATAEARLGGKSAWAAGDKAASGRQLLAPLDADGKSAPDGDAAPGDAAQGPGKPGKSAEASGAGSTYFSGAAVEVYGAGTSHYVRRRHELEEAFALFDRDASGQVASKDVQAVLELVGVADASVDIAKLIVEEIDVDGTGTIEFEEFFDWMAAKEASAKDKAGELVDNIFRIIDRDGNGTITTAELRITLSSLGEVMSHDDVQHIVREADENGDGVIDVHEFADMMKRSFEHQEFFL